MAKAKFKGQYRIADCRHCHSVAAVPPSTDISLEEIDSMLTCCANPEYWWSNEGRKVSLYIFQEEGEGEREAKEQ